MQKTKYYYGQKFEMKFLKSIFDQFSNMNIDKINDKDTIKVYQIQKKQNEFWDLDSIEEFLSEYNSSISYSIAIRINILDSVLIIEGDKHSIKVVVGFKNKLDIEKIFNDFEINYKNEKIDNVIEKEDSPIKIFIGHGRNQQWRDLKDHLHEKHGFDIQAYEIGPRAGFSVKEVLQSMLNQSSIAILVLTGEDEDNEGELHARENVIHEVGLFQGKIGFEKTIILIESGVKEFSNILGINHIKFSKNNIKETYGEILAIISREF